MEKVADFFILACKTTVDAACSHEITRRLLLGRKAMRNINKCVEKQKHYSAQQTGRCLAFSFGFLNFLFNPHWSLNSLSFLVFQDSQIILSIFYPVLKSAISLRSSDEKCIWKIDVRPQNSHCYQVVTTSRLYSGQRRKYTFSLKIKIKRNIISGYKHAFSSICKTARFELNFYMLCVSLFF